MARSTGTRHQPDTRPPRRCPVVVEVRRQRRCALRSPLRHLRDALRKFAELRPMQRWVAMSFSLRHHAHHPTIVRKVVEWTRSDDRLTATVNRPQFPAKVAAHRG